MEFLKGHGRMVALGVGLTVLAGGIAYFVWHQRRAGGAGAAEDRVPGPGL
jgi:hypothetical protein